ncbi:transcobalamin-2 [Mastacembelus armatus]|uniref:Transcobalamin II n=1 Tax=Mastacembelus armatus TaxID=205130 RepID=A0A3Q3MPV4_9TELE|nr:transcobalamin-2-like [Mastacembelus armatus]XP_026177226.1 transcobalamin-2-like [Mastacembelus armatus]XP_026177227.1 transcobalamin-2-like [Mastacembelus armatus]XP_026177228.1 transcobalamin-2-like [Mastacembelus armatus]
MLSLVIISLTLVACATGKPCDTEESNKELLLSLNKDLLRSLERQEGLPNPSVHLALRLSNHHNLAMENEHLNRLKNNLHNDLQNSLSNSQSVVGLLALYTLALKSSCYDLNAVTFTVCEKSKPLLTHLKKQMHYEKEHIEFSHRPSTNYYQYSLGVLALCVSGVMVDNHVSNKLIKAVEHDHFKHSGGTDTYAMAGMALQCLKDAGSYVQNAGELDTALSKVKENLLASRRTDGHIGNEFSTGLAVQALLAMGSQVEECAAAMEAMRTDARSSTYHNPMAISQILPALQKKSYLTVKSKECLHEDDTLVLEPIDPVVVLPSESEVALTVEVVMSNGAAAVYSVDVPKGSSLLEALELLMGKNVGFTFNKEPSLWGPFLSVVNGEQARQSDRRYWQLSLDGTALSQGVSDFKIEESQKITIKNTSY